MGRQLGRAPQSDSNPSASRLSLSLGMHRYYFIYPNLKIYFNYFVLFAYLFFLDSDIGFNSEDVLRLLSHNENIVSGTYPMKTIPIRYCVDVLQPEERKGDLLKVGGNGMGFVMIRRNVFADIAQKFPYLKYIAWVENCKRNIYLGL